MIYLRRNITSSSMVKWKTPWVGARLIHPNQQTRVCVWIDMAMHACMCHICVHHPCMNASKTLQSLTYMYIGMDMNGWNHVIIDG